MKKTVFMVILLLLSSFVYAADEKFIINQPPPTDDLVKTSDARGTGSVEDMDIKPPDVPDTGTDTNQVDTTVPDNSVIDTKTTLPDGSIADTTNPPENSLVDTTGVNTMPDEPTNALDVTSGSENVDTGVRNSENVISREDPPEIPKVGVLSNRELVRTFYSSTDKPRLEDYEFRYMEEKANVVREKASLTFENVELEKEIEVYEEDIEGIKETRSIVRIRIKPLKVMRNFRLYEKIPKSVAKDASEIIFYEGDYDSYEIIEADPLIVWNFGIVESEIEVSYGVKKEINEEDTEEGFTVPVAEVIEVEEAYSPKKIKTKLIFGGLILLGSMLMVGFFEARIKPESENKQKLSTHVRYLANKGYSKLIIRKYLLSSYPAQRVDRELNKYFRK